MKIKTYNNQIFDRNKHLISAKIKTFYPEDMEKLKTCLIGHVAERIEVELSITKDNFNDILKFLDYSKPVLK